MTKIKLTQQAVYTCVNMHIYLYVTKEIREDIMSLGNGAIGGSRDEKTGRGDVYIVIT